MHRYEIVVDHKQALENGGADKRWNMQYLCGCCDKVKTHFDNDERLWRRAAAQECM